MAGKTNPHFLFLLLTLLVLIVAFQIAAKPGGITLEVIHRHSPNSPFYQPNLTIDEQIRSLANQTIARSQYLANLRSLAITTNATTYHPETVRMLMNDIQEVALYNVRLGLGMLPLAFPPYRSYNFLVDTGSDLTWDCRNHRCFDVASDPPFPNPISTTYRPLPCNQDLLCEGRCDADNTYCTFERFYGDGGEVTGVLATETFNFDSSKGPSEREYVDYLVFGCVTDSNDRIGFSSTPNNQIGGFLGLGFGSHSFASQLAQGNGLFSYCLRRKKPIKAEPSQVTNSFIRFGADVERPEGMKLAALKYGSGGTIIDSGSRFSHITRPAHDVLVRALEDFFASLGNVLEKDTSGELLPLELCYYVKKPSEFLEVPATITFNFQTADMDLDAENTFLIKRDISGQVVLYFCLGIVPQNEPKYPTIIGAYQQTNYRFIHDTKSYTLYFGHEDCDKTS
ncbi:hypothetical protein M0R45_013651 [Rubus argutus]|uniref:Peptidase A1 domain-containing protein n=1 Tax=Rubus argutus TaxID=59490 RepID=A0AAW1XKC6_RUBAR